MKSVLVAEDRGEVLVGKLDDARGLRVSDARPLRIKGVVIATVEVEPAQGQLVEPGLALFDGKDEPAVVHEARHALHVELPRKLPETHAPRGSGIGLVHVEVRVRLGQVGRGALRPGVGESGAVEVSARRSEDQARHIVGVRRAVCRVDALVDGLLEGKDAVGGILYFPNGVIQNCGGVWRSWLARAVAIGDGKPIGDAPDRSVVELEQTFLAAPP